MPRPDGRAPEELRPISFERDFTEMADGSCLVSFGRTRVLCTASIADDVPRWMRGTGKGWVTAEYSMLPGSSPERVDREAARGKQSGRTVEIQRLIGRSLRAACDMTALGERQVVVDCDVLQADGGTRTASICGGYLALHDALTRLMVGRNLTIHPLHSYCAAISVGIVGGVAVLDLPYAEDSTAEVDMNVVMLRSVAGGEPRFVEVQGTAEGMAFTRAELDDLLALAELGLVEIAELQAEMVSVPPAPRRQRASLRASEPSSTVFAHCAPSRTGRHRQGAPMSELTLVCASANPDKVAEIQAILGELVELRPRPADVPDVVEDADTLEGNARLKAAAIAAAAGTAAVADDTGLEVATLGGAPGVRTGRYAGEDATYAENRTALLAALEGRPTVGPGSAPWRWSSGPTAGSWRPKASATGRSLVPSAASGGSATTPCSSPTTETAARSPR